MLKNKFKIKQINLRELVFPITKVAVILASIIVFLFALRFIYGIFNDIYSAEISENKQSFFDLENLKTVGPRWGIDVSGLK